MILDPSPAYVIKTLDVASGEKIFINVCTDSQVEAPNTLDASDIAIQVSKGEDWIVPIVVSTGRHDQDKAGQPCFVVDCCMHPSVVLLGIEDPSVKVLTVETCIELVEDRFGRMISRDYKFPRMKNKGQLEKTEVDPQMPHPQPGKNTSIESLTSSSPSSLPPSTTGAASSTTPDKPKPTVTVVETSSTDSPFYFHVYRGSFLGPDRPSHVVELDGEHHDVKLVRNLMKLGAHELDLKFEPSKVDSFYNREDETTYIMLWR